MRQDIEALHELARMAIEGPASKETLARAASIIRRATGAAQALVVYAEDEDFLTCSDTGDGPHAELTNAALAIVQRHTQRASGPVAFNLISHRVEDFTGASTDEQREFLALPLPTSESASEMCILRGPWHVKARAGILRFMQSAMPSLTIILDRFLNVDRGHRQGEKLSALANAAQLLAQSDDLEAALSALATAIAGSTASDYVSIDLYDADTERFVLRVLSESRFTGLSIAQAWRNSLDPDTPDVWNLEVMRTHQPFLSPDSQNDERAAESARQFFKLALIRSTAVFPMLFQDELLGTMAFAYYAPRTFPPEEVGFLQGFVTQAATALKALQMHKELQRYTHEFKSSAEEYIATTNLTGDIIAKLDKHGKWAFLNDAACQFYGKSREELLGTDSRAYVHPEDREPTAQAIRETRARKELTTGFVNRQVTPMGTRVVEWNGYPLFDEKGQYAGIQITGRDITERKQMEDALAAKTKEYIDTTNLTGDIIARLDKDGRWAFLNDAACQFYGKPREELLGTDSTASLHPEDVEPTAQVIRETRAKRGPRTGFANRQITPMGIRVVEWNGYPLFDDEGQYAGVQITGRDVSAHKQMEEALRQSEARYRLLAENTSDLIWTMDLGLRYTYMSPAITRMRGYTVEEIMGLTVAETMTPASVEVARKSLAEQLAIERMGHPDPNRATRLELEMYCKDGSTIWTEMNMTWLRDADGKPVGILGTTRDISERKQMEEERARLLAELEVRAITDSLTGLYNHAHFYQRLAEELERSKRYSHRFALVMLDVDAFKQYNDSRGHQAGDEMLRFVADCIRSGLRRSDIAFRYGGDEFAAILPHADSSKARAAVNRINRRIASSLKQMDTEAETRLSLSAGVACFPNDGTTADDLVRIADAALYEAKRKIGERSTLLAAHMP
jgi:diguanylate cyclase (GGDEF)-like protein/PAS domain S-box-containing protein